ncbi:MAG: sulfurtransferase, partial [Gammaproteobacteria bacterium]|nr:sulfurtransferase [Gammaproteobacteria bacterium]
MNVNKTRFKKRLAGIGFALTACTGLSGAGTLQTGEELLQAINQRISNVTTSELEQILQQQPNTVLIDVRSPREIHLLGGMIDGPRSYNISRGWLEFRITETVTDKDTPIVVYCGM